MNRPKIIELSPKLFNMIAAGEVVERPSSVVKELVENSIDANADVIRIELMNSGIDKITIIDNGIGMTKEDISQAIKPHATSKIQTENDLFNISTLGFRGEALPSIASISKVKITSSIDGYNGYFKRFEGGSLVEENIVSFPKGTKIEVNDIFYNTPARLKHLKSENVELSHIMLLINKFALAYPNISFVLTNNTKVLFSTDGKGSLESIISEIYGLETAKQMIPFENRSGLYKISGYTSKKTNFRSNKNAMFIMINNRLIKNQNIIFAITDAYKTILPIGKYPVCVLKIEADATLVDVNVHPTKEDVRFTDERELRWLVTSTISEALNKSDFEFVVNGVDVSSKYEKVEPVYKTEKKTISYSWDDFKEDKVISSKPVKKEEPVILKEVDIVEEESDFKYDVSFEKSIQEEVIFEKKEKIEEQTLDIEISKNNFQDMHYIGQYNKTYLLLEKEDTLYLIDQHAAMERVKYEETISKLSNEVKEFVELLLPIKLELSLSEINLLDNKSDELSKLGISYELFGNNTILVRVIPSWISKNDAEKLLLEIFTTIIYDRGASRAILLDNLAKIISCKSSIKANMNILDVEVNTLLESMDNCKNPYTCPHGRPTVISFSKYEIEKLFKRVM